jgi:hypothetical protein
MTRPPFNKASTMSTESLNSSRRVGRYMVTGAYPARAFESRTILPSDWGVASPAAAELGAAWESIADDKGQVAPRFAVAVSQHRAITQGLLPLMQQRGISHLADLLPEHLMALEDELAETMPVAGGDRMSALLTVLREVPDSSFVESTRIWRTHPSRLPIRPTQPTNELPERLLQRVLRTADKDVSMAVRRSAKDPGYLLGQSEALSLYILLLFETGWSMDVLKHFGFHAGAQTRVTDWSAHDGQYVEVSYLKYRGPAKGIQMFGKRHARSAGNLFGVLRDLTEPLRQVAATADNSLRDDTPWLCWVEDAGRLPAKGALAGGHVVHVFDRSSQFRWWLRRHCLIEATSEERYTFRSLRVTAKAIRIHVSDKEGLTLADLVEDHGVDVFSRHYTRNARLMNEVGRTFLEEIAGRAQDIIQDSRPTIVDGTGQVAEGNCDPEIAEAALQGDLEAGLTACRDPYNSPLAGAVDGALCGTAFRACFTCRNAIVTPRHVKRMQLILEAATTAKADTPPPVWQAVWQPTVDFILDAVRVLAPHAIDASQHEGLLLDTGLRR